MKPFVHRMQTRLSVREIALESYKKQDQVDPLFPQINRSPRLSSRFDKLDAVFLFFIHFALIVDTPPGVNRSLHHRILYLMCVNGNHTV